MNGSAAACGADLRLHGHRAAALGERHRVECAGELVPVRQHVEVGHCGVGVRTAGGHRRHRWRPPTTICARISVFGTRVAGGVLVERVRLLVHLVRAPAVGVARRWCCSRCTAPRWSTSHDGERRAVDVVHPVAVGGVGRGVARVVGRLRDAGPVGERRGVAARCRASRRCRRWWCCWRGTAPRCCSSHMAVRRRSSWWPCGSRRCCRGVRVVEVVVRLGGLRPVAERSRWWCGSRRSWPADGVAAVVQRLGRVLVQLPSVPVRGAVAVGLAGDGVRPLVASPSGESVVQLPSVPVTRTR